MSYVVDSRAFSDIIHVEPMAMSTKYLMEEPTSTFDELDPELASIALQVKAGQYAHTPAGSRGTTPALDGGPEVVTIRVKWKAHPLNEAARPQQWDFKMKRVSYTVSLMECSHYMHVFSTIPSSVCSKKQLTKQECSLITSL